MDGGGAFGDELAQERLALLKGMHPKMRVFWGSAEAEGLRKKYGEFPPFWQDLDTWDHISVMKKLFLIVCERKECGKSVSFDDVMQIETSLTSTSSASTAAAAAAAIGGQSREQQEEQNSLAGATMTGANKKRRNRWQQDESSSVGPEQGLAAPGEGGTGEPIPQTEQKKSRRSRWGGDALTGMAGVGSAAIAQPTAAVSQEVIQQTMVLKLQLQQLNERLLNVAQEAALIEQDPGRTPSPAPKYDKDGKRTNTREVRMREELTKERTRLMEEIVKLNPSNAAAVDLIKVKPTRKVFIPIREYPTYNFIGLILGPRGNTHKKMESETGCKISIRGKGSMKEGSKGRSSQNEVSAEDEDLHVFITADNEEGLDAAAKMVEDLLRPIDDDKNDHKQKQLRELALINGTLREDEFCPVCGERGHRQFECPHRAKTFKASGVKCSVCGDLSHPTRDCPLKSGADDQSGSNALALDSEYDSFIAELDGRKFPRAEDAFCQPVSRGVPGEATFTTAASAAADQSRSNQVSAQPVAKRQQTVIHVTSVMTGLAPLPLISTTVVTAAGGVGGGYEHSQQQHFGGFPQQQQGGMPYDPSSAYSQHQMWWHQQQQPPPLPVIPPPPPPSIPPPPPN